MTSANVSFTFDNLGEAADLELGLWPRGKPLGRHFSVIEVLPRLLRLLAEHQVRATFFVEGINADAYPHALEAIAAGGHELGLHAWRHERWDRLEPARERQLLERGTAALAGLGQRPLGFRPPGGRLTPATAELLNAHGYDYVSPSDDVRAGDGLRVLPFRWPQVDAYHLYPGPLRRRLVGDEDGNASRVPARIRGAVFRGAIRAGAIRGVRRLRETELTELETVARRGGQVTLVFHPFLLERRASFTALSALLARATRGDLSVAPLCEVGA
jgi:peptidoglycan/xylan/chitin deacetylase (PgdA/CDA1 family)